MKANNFPDNKNYLADTPIDKITAIGLSRGEGFVTHGDSPHWRVKPDICVRFIGPREHNLIGRQFGTLLVVGFLANGNQRGTRRSSWLVRCSCGDYEIRTTPTLKKLNTPPVCSLCHRRKKNWDWKLKQREDV